MGPTYFYFSNNGQLPFARIYFLDIPICNHFPITAGEEIDVRLRMACVHKHPPLPLPFYFTNSILHLRCEAAKP
jgi:hypothetical protein